MAIDPVCKMEINEADAAAHTNYDGEDYYFCSEGCKEKFEHNPAQYLDSTAT